MAYEAEHSLKLYLTEIAKTPLLTAEEEITLAERIKNGDPEARAHMIKANLRLVVKIAQDYANYGMPVTDLISEGNIGLMKAVERFDPEKGKVSTYAAWWIKQSIKRALGNQSKTIRIPVHMVDKIAKMNRIKGMLAEAYRREPTDEEIADEIGGSPKKIAMLRAASQRPVSLDAQVNEGEGTTYGEVIADEHMTDPSESLSDKNMYGELGGLLDGLDERERRIIDERFGLGGRKSKTLEEVARQFGVTRERIRQLQNSALTKMRKALRKKEKAGTRPKPHKPKLTSQESSVDSSPLTKDDIISTLSIENDEMYNEYLGLLLDNSDIGNILDNRGEIRVKTFWKQLEAIIIPKKEQSAAVILRGVVLYHFSRGGGEIPNKITGPILKKFLKLLAA